MSNIKALEDTKSLCLWEEQSKSQKECDNVQMKRHSTSLVISEVVILWF